MTSPKDPAMSNEPKTIICYVCQKPKSESEGEYIPTGASISFWYCFECLKKDPAMSDWAKLEAKKLFVTASTCAESSAPEVYVDQYVDLVVKALLAAELRGFRRGVEESAKVADEREARVGFMGLSGPWIRELAKEGE